MDNIKELDRAIASTLTYYAESLQGYDYDRCSLLASAIAQLVESYSKLSNCKTVEAISGIGSTDAPVKPKRSRAKAKPVVEEVVQLDKVIAVDSRDDSIDGSDRSSDRRFLEILEAIQFFNNRALNNSEHPIVHDLGSASQYSWGDGFRGKDAYGQLDGQVSKQLPPSQLPTNYPDFWKQQ